ncbi:MAG: accessory factor UbiK family protein [Alphaproteobacteria bacterium]
MPKASTQFLEDMGHVLAALLGTAVSARGQARGKAKQKLGLLLQRLQLAGREDFDALHDMLKAARSEQESLKARVAALEGKSENKGGPATVKAPINRKLKTGKNSPGKSSRKRNKARR